MSDKKLFQLAALEGAGGGDLVYVSKADGSADGAASFAALQPVLGGVLSATFAAAGHGHTLNQIADAGALAAYAAIAPSADVRAVLAAADYGAVRSQLSLAGVAVSGAYADLAGSPSLGALAAKSAAAEADLSISDVTTGNVSVSAHGFAPKAPNDASQFLNGTGAWSTPAGAGTVTTTGSPASGNLARFSGSTAITNATVGAFLDSEFGASQGMVLYRGASGWAALAAGTAGQVLQTQGAGGNPVWATPACILVSRITTSSSQTSIAFSSMPSGYKSLRISAHSGLAARTPRSSSASTATPPTPTISRCSYKTQTGPLPDPRSRRAMGWRP